jgi:hypothetical protein
MSLLVEMGLAHRIPGSVVESALQLIAGGTWPVFIRQASDLPQTEEDKTKMDCCHCELAVFYMTLSACGCDLETAAPWIRRWFLEHQLPDGGLNCDPRAYSGSMKSSVISTLPPLEAVLRYTKRDFTSEETTFLDGGAHYLIKHRLCRSVSTGEILQPDWVKPIFPRFFEYDILRGMMFLTDWSQLLNRPMPVDVLREGIELLKPLVRDGQLMTGTQIFGPRGRWVSDSFPLLDLVGSEGLVSEMLTREYQRVSSLAGQQSKREKNLE